MCPVPVGYRLEEGPYVIFSSGKKSTHRSIRFNLSRELKSVPECLCFHDFYYDGDHISGLFRKINLLVSESIITRGRYFGELEDSGIFRNIIS